MRTALLGIFVGLIFVAACSDSNRFPLSVETRRQGSGTALSLDQIGTFRITQNEVRDANAFRVPDSTVVVSTWQEQDETGQWNPFYAISLKGKQMAVIRQTSGDLLLRFGKFDPLATQPAGLAAPPELVTNVRIVQFVTQVLPEYRSQLEAAGARIYRFLANNALIVEASGFVANNISQMPFVRWVGPYRPEYKREANLVAGDGPQRFHIETWERGLAAQNYIEERINEIGGSVDQKLPQGPFMDATLTWQQLQQVLGLDQVARIDEWSPPESDDVIVRDIGGADYLADRTGFTGQGVRAEVMDDGCLATHQEFGGSLIAHGRAVVGGHGTNTTGINFAQGVDDRATGVVPMAQGITAVYPVTDRYQHTFELVHDPYFGVYQSNSWGDNLTTQYTTISAQMDDIIFGNDILIAQSQSNSGTQQSRPQAWAKNIVSVGGLKHCNPAPTNCTADMSLHVWNHSGSIGPAADGRIKPDLAHFYDGVFTTSASSPTSYNNNFGGTSAATPIVAGHFGLFFEMWHNGIFGNPISDTVFNSRPHQSTARAFVINTARQWDFSGLTDDRTRTHQGWGLPSVKNLYDLRGQIFYVDETDVLQPLASTTYQLTVLDATPALKATMVYKDPMGTTSSTLHRINDLDLQVVSPSGAVYWGNNGLREGQWSTPDGSPDPLDTVENVFVQNPEAGIWSITVIATEINQDSHPATPELDADYSLVVSGVSLGAAPVKINNPAP
jgi:hypothetical protein